jgi:hypothetical protein
MIFIAKISQLIASAIVLAYVAQLFFITQLAEAAQLQLHTTVNPVTLQESYSLNSPNGY